MSDENEDISLQLENPWQRATRENPYLHNAFAMLGIDPDAGELRLYDACQRIDEQLAAQQPMSIHGKQLSQTDVSRVRTLASSPMQFALERLLVHTFHDIDLTSLESELSALESQPIPRAESLLPLPVHNMRFAVESLQVDPLSTITPEPLTVEQWRAISAPERHDEQIWHI